MTYAEAKDILRNVSFEFERIVEEWEDTPTHTLYRWIGKRYESIKEVAHYLINEIHSSNSKVADLAEIYRELANKMTSFLNDTEFNIEGIEGVATYKCYMDIVQYGEDIENEMQKTGGTIGAFNIANAGGTGGDTFANGINTTTKKVKAIEKPTDIVLDLFMDNITDIENTEEKERLKAEAFNRYQAFIKECEQANKKSRKIVQLYYMHGTKSLTIMNNAETLRTNLRIHNLIEVEARQLYRFAKEYEENRKEDTTY